jgi:hypothetical protein
VASSDSAAPEIIASVAKPTSGLFQRHTSFGTIGRFSIIT